MKRTIAGILGAILLLASGQALAATSPSMGRASLAVAAQIHLSRAEPAEPVTCPGKARKGTPMATKSACARSTERDLVTRMSWASDQLAR